MKKLVYIAMLLTLLVSCGQKTAEPNRFFRSELRLMQVKGAKTVDEKADLLYMFAHQDAVEVEDTELYAEDPHAYWLYRCMECMDVYTRKPKELWAMYQALERCVGDYNQKLGRKHGSVELALRAVEELHGGYAAGTQYEMNRGTGIERMMDEIRMIGKYRYMAKSMEADGAEQGLDSWYGKEYMAWHRFMYLAEVLMYNHTFGMAYYSSAPMDMNLMMQDWFKGRLQLLDMESNCIWSYSAGEARMDVQPKTDDDLADIINHFYNCVPTAGWDDIYSSWADNDDDVMRPYREDAENDGHPRLIAYHLKKAIKDWQAVREDIALFLPADKQPEYRQLTAAVQNHIYSILESLKPTYS